MISKNNETKHLSLQMNFFHCILQLYHFSDFNQMIAEIVIISGEFQYITFLWMPLFVSTNVQIFGNQFNYAALLIYFSRLDELITFQFQSSQFHYLIPLAAEIIFSILPLTLIMLTKHLQSLLKFTAMRWYLYISSLYFQTYFLIFFVPFTIFCAESIILLFENENPLLSMHFSFIILTLLLIILKLLIISLLCRETIDLKTNKFLKLNQSLLNHVQTLLQIIQIVVYGSVQVINNGLILQSIIVAIISLLKYIQIFQFEYTERRIVYINIIITSFGTIISIFNLIDALKQQSISIYFNIIMFLLVLLLCKIAFQFYHYEDNRVSINIIKLKQYSTLKFCLTKYVSQHFQKDQKQLVDAIVQGWINENSELTTFEPTTENKQGTCTAKQESISTEQSNLFVIKKLSHYVKSVKKNKEFDLHYAALLYQFGFINLALQQINQLINYSTNQVQSKGFLNDSDNPSLSNELNTGKSHAKFSQSETSKSNKSITNDLADIARKSQQKKNKLLLIGHHQLSGVQIAKAFYLKNQIKKEIQKQFYERNKTIQQLNEIQLGVELYLSNEKRNQSLKNSILLLINEKIIFTQLFTTKKTFSTYKLFKQALQLSKLQLQLETKLALRYQQFPSLKLQSILMFFQGEILNNYLEAFKYRSLTSMPDEQLINMNQNIKQQFFTKKAVYLSLMLDENSSLSVQKKTENALKFFQIDVALSKYFNTVDYILPLGIKNEHKLLVQRFIATSKSKFYLNSCQTFFRLNHLLMKSCQLLFDIHFDSLNHYKFSAFFSESVSQSSFILVDVNHNIGGITESFFEQIGFNERVLEKIRSFEESSILVDLLIPKFQKLTEQRIQSAITEIRFLKEMFLENDEVDFKKNRHNSISTSNWSNLEKIYIFEAEVFILYQEIYGYNYYVVEIKEIKQQYHQSKSKSNTPMSRNQDHIEECFELSELSEIEATANSPKAFKMQNTFKQEENQYVGKKSENQVSYRIDISQQQIPISYQDYVMQDLHILSPNTSNTPWMDSSQIPFRINQKQQEYFTKQRDLSISCQESKELEIDGQEEVAKHYSNKFQNRIIEKIGRAEDQQSSNTIYKGIKKSQYYKKYEMINSIIEPIYPNSLRLFIGFQHLTYLITMSYFLIVVVGVSTDLNRFIGEIDMIQVHAGIMNPHDLYLQMRQTIFTYQGYLAQGKLTQSQYENLSNPLYENIGIGYYEFKDGFIEWLSNDYLTPFFKDKNITVYYMLYDATQTYPVTYNVREGLLTTLTYYYNFLLRFQARLNPANQTYQIFQFANVYNFHYWLEELALEVLTYSKNRSQDISKKWNTIWIVYLIIAVLPLIGSLYYYRYFRSKFERYINLFRYCSNYKMELQLEKLKNMIKTINKNTEYVFTYTFNIGEKEEQIIKEKQHLDHNLQKQKDVKTQQQFKNLPFFLGFIFVFTGWLIFLALSIVENTYITVYLDKYQSTADLFKLLQDMTLYAGTLYRNRDFAFKFSSLPYLRQFDNEYFYTTMYTGLATIDKFLEQSYSFDQERYQASEDFLTFFVDIQEENMCDILGKDILGFLEQYCSTSLQGNLKLGLIPTLKFIRDSITNQMSVNNFTKQLEYTILENEGGLVVFRATQQMSKQFKLGMINVTEIQISISNAISIVFLICSLIIMIYVMFVYFKKLKNEIQLARRFVLLIPPAVLFQDDQFDRHVRLIVASQEY